MFTTLLVLLLATILLGFGGWYLFEFIRYLVSGEYAVHKRFWEVTRQ